MFRRRPKPQAPRRVHTPVRTVRCSRCWTTVKFDTQEECERWAHDHRCTDPVPPGA